MMVKGGQGHPALIEIGLEATSKKGGKHDR